MVFAHVHSVLEQTGQTISRASVIFFLNRLVENKLASFVTKSGKGGYHKRYSLIDGTRAEFDNSVLDKFLFKLSEIFPDNERIKVAVA